MAKKQAMAAKMPAGRLKLDERKMALAGGILGALGMGGLGVLASMGWGALAVSIIGTLYLGYDASLSGIIVGMIWAFFDWGIAAYILAWLYNRV